MVVRQIYSNNLNGDEPNISERFSNAVGFIIDTPLLDSELQIDCFLQVYFPTESSEKIKNYPLGKIEEQVVLLNLTDTESLVSIPSEFLDTDLEMALLFLGGNSIFLEAFVIEKKYNLSEELTAIKESLSTIQQSNSLVELITELQSALSLIDISFLTQLSQLDLGIFTLFQGLKLLIPNEQANQLESSLRSTLDLNEEFL